MCKSHSRDEIVSYEVFNREIEALRKVLEQLQLTPSKSSVIEADLYNAFACFYYSVFLESRPTMSRQNADTTASALAGLGDLAAKINRASATGSFEKLRPHLKNMIEGGALMNAPNKVTDQAGNKNSELYVGCLAAGAGLNVDLEDPQKGAAGKNPDVMMTFEDALWSIAVKVSHGASAGTIFGNVKKGVSQVEASGAHGLVFVNAKNIVPPEVFRAASPFASRDAAVEAVRAELGRIFERLRADIVAEDWIGLFAGKRARPLVPMMLQATIEAHVCDKIMYLPIKVLRVFCPPHMPQEPDKFTGLDASGWNLMKYLNEELQRNPGSTAPIGG